MRHVSAVRGKIQFLYSSGCHIQLQLVFKSVEILKIQIVRNGSQVRLHYIVEVANNAPYKINCFYYEMYTKPQNTVCAHYRAI